VGIAGWTDSPAWVIAEGVEKEFLKQSMRSVLFVCTANICRSPMAMGLMRVKAQGDKDEWRIDSAGVWAQRGLPAAQYTLEVLHTRGVDLDKYASKPLTVEMIEDFFLILTMERNHQEALHYAFPQHTGKIFMLSQMVGKKNDIVDPVGGPLAEFENTAQEIEQILNKGYVRIRKLSAGGKTASLPQR
jgi:protein-tyrosine-phosphatase